MRRFVLALAAAAALGLAPQAQAQGDPTFGMEFEFAGAGNRITDFSEMPFENYKEIMKVIVNHYGGQAGDIKKIEFEKPTSNLEKFPTGMRPLFRAEWTDARGRTWLVEPEFVASSGFDGYEVVTPPMDDTKDLRDVLTKIRESGHVREGRRSGVHLTIDAKTLIKNNGDAKALANLIIMHENYSPMLRRMFNPVRGGGHENYFARSLSVDHHDILREIDALPANERTRANLEGIFKAREAREASLHEADPMDTNSWNKLWKYRDMNLAKALNVNANHDGNSRLVEFRMFDLADPKTHSLEADLYRRMVAKAAALAAEGKTVELTRARPTEGADPSVNETPRNLEEAKLSAREMIEFVGLNPTDFEDVIDRNVRTEEVRTPHEFRGALEALPGGRMTHNGKAFTYGFELEGRGNGFVKIAVPKDAAVKRRWGSMTDEAKRAHYDAVVGENHSSVKQHFDVDTQKHRWLDPYWYVEGTGNWEIHSRVMEDVTKVTDAMRTAKELTGKSGKGFHLHMRDNAPDWEKLEARGSEFADFMERSANWVYLKRVERLRTDLSLKSWSNARFSESEVESISRIEETDRATLRVAEVNRGGYGDGEYIDLEIRGFTKYIDDVEVLAKIFANNLKTGEFGTWRHTDNVMPSEAWGGTPEGLEYQDHVKRYLRDVEGKSLTPEKARILEGLQGSWADRAGGDSRAYSTGVATPLLNWGNEASLSAVDRRAARFAQEEYLGWLNRYADRIANGEFGVDLELASEKAFAEHMGLTPAEAAAVVRYRRVSGGTLTADDAARAVALSGVGSEADVEKIARMEGLDLDAANETELRERMGLTAAKAKKVLTYREAHDVESSLAKSGLTEAARKKMLEKAKPLDIGSPDVTAEMIRARTGLSAAVARDIVTYRSANPVSSAANLRTAGLDAEEVREVMALVSEATDLRSLSATELAEALEITEAKASKLIDARTANPLSSFNDVVSAVGISEAAKNKLRTGLRTLANLNSATYDELRATGVTENQARKLINHRDAGDINSESVLRNVLGESVGRRAYARVAGLDLSTADVDRLERAGVEWDVAEKIVNHRDPHRIGRGSEFARYNSETAFEMLEEAEVVSWNDSEAIEERTREIDLKNADFEELTERLGMTNAAAKKFLNHRDANRVSGNVDALKAAGFTAAEAKALVKASTSLNPAEASIAELVERTGLTRAKATKLKKLAGLDYTDATIEELRTAGITAENAERVIAFRDKVEASEGEIDYKEVVRTLRLRVRKWVRESGLADSMLRSLLPRDRADVEVTREVRGEAENFSSVRRGATGEFVPSRVSYSTVGDVFASVREAGLSVNADRMLAAATAAEKANLATAREGLSKLTLKIVETNDILADRTGETVRLSTGLLNEIETRVEARPAGERAFVRNRILGLILGHETAHAGGMKSEKLADAESIRILARANGLGKVLDVAVPIEAAEVRAAVEAFTKPTGASHFDNFVTRLRNLMRYGSPGRRIDDLERATRGEEVDRLAKYRRADGTLDWKRMGREGAVRESVGTAHFALALFLKELAVVVQTGDRVRIEEFFDGLMTTEFYTHYGMFVIGARAGEVAYVRYLQRYIKPRFVNGILKSNLVLAAGLALPEIVNGTFTGKGFAISLTSLGLSSAAVKSGMAGIKWVVDLKKAKQAGTLARTGIAAGRLAKFGGWFYTAAELAVILYFAEDVEHAINKYVDRRAARKDLAKSSREFFKAVSADDATPEAVAAASRTYHDAWTGYRDFLYTPMYMEEAVFADRLEKAARKAKISSDERTTALDRIRNHAALRRSIEARYGSLDKYAEHLTREDEKELNADVEKYGMSYANNRDRLLKELYDDNKRGSDLFSDVEGVEDRILAVDADGASVWNRLRGNAIDNAIEGASVNRLETYDDEAAVLDATIAALRKAGQADRADALVDTRRIVGVLRDADDKLAHGGKGMIDVVRDAAGAAEIIEGLDETDPAGD